MRAFETNDWLLLNSMIYRIYTTEDFEAMRQQFLEQLKMVIDFDSADFYLASQEGEGLCDPVTINCDPGLSAAYDELDYSRGIMYSGKMLIYRETDIISDEARVQTEYYQKVYRPNSWHFALQMVLARNKRFLGVVSLYRTIGKQDFQYEDIFVLDILKEEFQAVVLAIVSKVVIPILPFFIASTFCGLAYEGTITKQLPVFLQVILIVMAGHYLWMALLYALAGAYSGKNPLEVVKHYGPAYITAVGTMSSAATLAVALRCAGKSKVLRRDMVDFGIPLFANIHLCGSVLTETVFAWPGVGRLMIQSVEGRDTPMVMGCIILMTICFSFVNLIVDLLYGAVDPRVRTMYR